jgi:hypothetical protein
MRGPTQGIVHAGEGLPKGLFMQQRAYPRAFPCWRRLTKRLFHAREGLFKDFYMLDKAYRKSSNIKGPTQDFVHEGKGLPKGLSIHERAYQGFCSMREKAYQRACPCKRGLSQGFVHEGMRGGKI